MSPARELRAATPLFRAEAVEEQESRWLGQVLIVPRSVRPWPRASRACWPWGPQPPGIGHTTRTERLSGWLAPVTATSGQDGGAGDTRLEARLYGPGEAIGDIRPGQAGASAL